MDDLSARLEELGETVADASNRTSFTSSEDFDAARTRFLAATAAPHGRSTTHARRSALRRGLMLAPVIAAACAVVFFARVHAQRAVSFTVGAVPVQGAVGEWLAASDATVPVAFSEGTSLTLDPGAQVRVTETTERGAGVLLERGRLHAAVVHHSAETRWSVRAGPFEVRVTGTRFDVAWEPGTETFEIVMNEGTVMVAGPLVPTGRLISAGERLRISTREGKLELLSRGAEEGAQAAAPACPPGVPATGSSEPVGSAAMGATASPPHATIVAPAPAAAPAEPRWQDLASAGKYKGAFAAIDHAGFAQELDRASSSELLSLSDVARYAGRPAAARDALLALRRRYGSRGRSAFLLGKIAADQLGAYADAGAWFETYLSEEPHGALAEQALGRLMELRKGGEPAYARQVAQRYLAAYPKGAYASLASSLLEP